jgi:hypothetical protein
MKPKSLDVINEQEIDREIAEIDERLKELQGLQQRRSDLYNFKLLAQRLWGKEQTNGHAPQKVEPYPKFTPKTNSEYAYQVVSAHANSLTLDELVTEMRAAGWKCSGEMEVDKKRVYAAIYNNPSFLRDGKKWGSTGVPMD